MEVNHFQILHIEIIIIIRLCGMVIIGCEFKTPTLPLDWAYAGSTYDGSCFLHSYVYVGVYVRVRIKYIINGISKHTTYNHYTMELYQSGILGK